MKEDTANFGLNDEMLTLRDLYQSISVLAPSVREFERAKLAAPGYRLGHESISSEAKR